MTTNVELQDTDGRTNTGNGIEIDILGESRPFSKYGQSICYHVTVNGYQFLVDCGAPIFEKLSREEIEQIDGLFATHSHEDHKRWFTDLAIYMNYLTEGEKRLTLLTIDPIHEEYLKNSRGALERTLSTDSRKVLEVPYKNFVQPVTIGPTARYQIVRDHHDGGPYGWRVVDENGETVPPDRAKVVIMDPEQANRPRMLFRDPETSKWVEPVQYYSFESEVFYRNAQNTLELDEDREGPSSVEISPIKDPVWHGPPTIGIDIRTPDERVVFSSDTVYDPDLWRSLANEEREVKLHELSQEEFESSSVIYGDINHFIEQSWSQERLHNALGFYEDAVVIHDCGPYGDPVHTDYAHVRGVDCEELILTHCPDRFISEFPIAVSGKTFRIKNNEVREKVDDEFYPLEADIYMRDSNQAYVGFQKSDGPFQVIRKENGGLEVKERSRPSDGQKIMHVELYRDIQGEYYPYLDEENQSYQIRSDHRVERVTRTATGSEGTIVEHVRMENGRVPSFEATAETT